jgi:transposase
VAEPWPHCQAELTVHDQADVHAYEQIELPALKPDITRVHRHAGVCPCCQRRFQAPVPAGLEPGSPFGPKLCALVVHLHVTQAIGLSLRRSACHSGDRLVTQAIGFERLSRLLNEVFGMTISEGALVNLLRRAAEPLSAQARAPERPSSSP